MGFPDPIRLAVPAFVALVLLEAVLMRRWRPGARDWRDSLTSVSLGLGNLATTALFGATIVAAMLALTPARLFDVPIAWWSVALCVVLDDLAYYVFHRSAHRVRWFWASHVVHHSSRRYDLTTALRQSWTGLFSLAFLFRLPLLWIGFPIELVLFVGAINLLYQFWIHTELIGRMPRWFEAVMNTPSHHRVHHATNPRYLDRNYAGMFIVWDRLFCTFEAERADEPPRYGLVRDLDGYNVIRAALHEWAAIARDLAAAQSWRHAWGIVARPPGWRPDGAGSDTADAIRARWLATQPAK